MSSVQYINFRKPVQVPYNRNFYIVIWWGRGGGAGGLPMQSQNVNADHRSMCMNYASNDDAQIPEISTINCYRLTQSRACVSPCPRASSTPFETADTTSTCYTIVNWRTYVCHHWGLYTSHLQWKHNGLFVLGSFPGFLAPTPVNTKSLPSIIIMNTFTWTL